VHLTLRVPEAKQLEWQDRHEVELARHARVVRDGLVEEGRVGGVADAWGAKGYASDGRAAREAEHHHERVELGEGAAERVAEECDTAGAVRVYESMHGIQDLARGLGMLLGEPFVRLHAIRHAWEQRRIERRLKDVDVCQICLKLVRVCALVCHNDRVLVWPETHKVILHIVVVSTSQRWLEIRYSRAGVAAAP